MRYDVVVVGGGGAGLAAAVAAASRGARTALVERYGFLGGMATAGMVGTVCGLYRTSRSGPPKTLNDAFPASFARRLSAMPGCEEPVRRGPTFVLPYTPFAFACVADEFVASTPNLDLYLHAHLVGLDTTRLGTAATRIESLRVATWETTLELNAGAVVDTTGDALVAQSAAVDTETVALPERQLPSLVFVLQNVQTETLLGGARLAVLRNVAAAEQRGVLPRGCSNLSLRRTAQPGEVVCILALSGIADQMIAAGRQRHGRPLDRPARDWLTAAEQEGRRRALAIVGFLQTLPAFSGAFLSHAAPQVGVRESRRIVGWYELTRDDVLSARKFTDGVARASWPIELWRDGDLGATYEYLDDGEDYEIPLRCLRARGVENLFAAGRCMSATHEALASARVIGTCLATGEAAGTAAAAVAEGRLSAPTSAAEAESA